MSGQNKTTRGGNRLLDHEERIGLKRVVAARRAERAAVAAEVERERDETIRRKSARTSWKKRLSRPATWEGSLELNRAQAQAIHKYFIAKPWSEGDFTITEQRGDGELWATSPWGELVVIPRTGGYRVVAEALEGTATTSDTGEAGPGDISHVEEMEGPASNGR